MLCLVLLVFYDFEEGFGDMVWLRMGWELNGYGYNGGIGVQREKSDFDS